MPEPINPHPSTPTVLIGMLVLFTGGPGVQEKSKKLLISCNSCKRSLDSLNDRSNTLTAADTSGGEAAFQATPAKFECERQQQARAGHSEGMAERDGAAVHVDAIAIEAQLLLDRQVLGREGLVDFD